MTGCDRLQSGDIELYFYDELESSARSAVERHLRSCSECRRAFDELSTIRTSLAARPVVATPAGADWTAFMRRLDETVRFEQDMDEAVQEPLWSPPRVVPEGRLSRDGRYASHLAIAALLTLVTSGLVFVARSTERPISSSAAAPTGVSMPPVAPAMPDRSTDAAFAALSEQHFERSKLVVLGLANKDPRHVNEADWAYERALASSLLSDTRLYRMAAEDRGMKALAGVMGDLELVLLQTSLADAPDTAVLQQIQRLIDKRDLVTKMDVAATATGS